MASFGRARRAPGPSSALGRPFIALLAASLLLLLARDAADPSGVVHSIVLGVGTGDGVRLDDIVVSETGVVGRVSEVGANYSKVVLVTDSASTVSALVQGSRAAGIVRGQFGDTLVMDWI